ncbi:Tll0287-like domain-containing protein [Lutibacter sp.]
MFKKVAFLITLVSLISCTNSLSKQEKKDYLQKGKEIAKASFKELSNHLMSQMQMGGPAQAVPFCNVQAIPVTESLSNKYNVTIKRTSDKVRNPKNAPTKREQEVISTYKALKAKGEKLTPIVEIDAANKKHFYAPIIVNKKCLSCHGTKGEELSVKTDSLIKTMYPKDLAVDYKIGDVRGVWSITFN